MPVIDPWILLVLILAVVAPGLASLVSTEIGARARPGRGWAIFALAFFVLYTGARMILHGRAVAVVESRLYAGSVPLRVAAWPTFASPLVWTGYAETQTFWSLHRVDLTRDFDPSLGRIYYKPEPSPVFEAARRDRTVRSFLEFSQYPLWRAMPLAEPEGATRVEFIDVRFGPPEQKRFTTTVVLDSQLRVLRSEFRFGRPGPPTAPRD